MSLRVFLASVLLLIPSIISKRNSLEEDLFDAQLQSVDSWPVLEEGSGLEVEGSGSSCEDSLFGCCVSSSLPAHGPHQTGCCLLEGEEGGGCCPDFQRRQSPGQECGCEGSKFGCCPDTVTARWDQDDGGCGCKHTTFGCCQDQFTTASGKDKSTGRDQVDSDCVQDPTMRAAPAGPRTTGAAQTERPGRRVLMERTAGCARTQSSAAVRTTSPRQLELTRKVVSVQAPGLDVALTGSLRLLDPTLKVALRSRGKCVRSPR